MPQYDFERFFDLSLDMLCIASADGYFKRVNASFQRTLGWTPEELTSRPFVDFIHPDDVAATLVEVKKLASGRPTILFRNRYRCSDGNYRHLLWTGVLESEGVLFAIARDTTELLQLASELEKSNARLAQLAVTDGLTQIANRNAFDEQLDGQLQLMFRMSRPLSLLMLDIDYFKQYNDRHGHQAGDEALKKVASLLRMTARVTDVVARYGGEEFAVVLPNTDEEGAMQMAQRFTTAIRAHPWPHGTLTVSMGVATLPAGGTTGAQRVRGKRELLGNADRALYVSKQNGRDRVTHASETRSADRAQGATP